MLITNINTIFVREESGEGEVEEKRKMIIVNIIGGLGNQMFQYALGIL